MLDTTVKSCVWALILDLFLITVIEMLSPVRLFSSRNIIPREGDISRKRQNTLQSIHYYLLSSSVPIPHHSVKNNFISHQLGGETWHWRMDKGLLKKLANKLPHFFLLGALYGTFIITWDKFEGVSKREQTNIYPRKQLPDHVPSPVVHNPAER